MRHIPNILTIIRIALVPVYAYLFSDASTAWSGFILFLFMSVTDYLDGYLARKYKWVSDFGKIWDPFADKLLVYSAFFMLIIMGFFPLIPVLLMLVREIGVTMHRNAALAKGKVIAAVWSGKVKTTVQLAAIISGMLNVLTNGALWHTDLILLYAALVLTLYSGIDYIVKNKGVVTTREFTDKSAESWLTLFSVGKIGVAPGTFGSLAAVAAYWFLLKGAGWMNLLWMVPVFLSGAFLASGCRRIFGDEDPSSVVLDEFVGQFIPLLFAGGAPVNVLVAFVAFRFFDILKPFPVNIVDRRKDGWGVMGDDAVAGIMAAAVVYLFDLFVVTTC